MRIINLIENTEGRSGCAYAHGLSFYVETEKHKLLLDLGPSGETLKNAQALGIDLAKVDTVILSHGHYDHSGGIMPFAGINDQAVIYMQESATGEYYADNGRSAPERYEYIGIDKKIARLPRVRFLQGDHRIDDELELFRQISAFWSGREIIFSATNLNMNSFWWSDKSRHHLAICPCIPPLQEQLCAMCPCILLLPENPCAK